MGRIYIKIIPAVVAVTLPLSASAFDFPRDLPTFEALMALHKCVKKDEDQALTRVATSFGEAVDCHQGSKEVQRCPLDSRLKAQQRILIRCACRCNIVYRKLTLSSCRRNIRILRSTHTSMSRRSLLWHGTMDANVAISREIKHC